ncbi:MAG: M15 family metallopeptidase [Clostridiales bacterium]|nr:M15 family metallopeptidase [Clostridiales bacterium]
MGKILNKNKKPISMVILSFLLTGIFFFATAQEVWEITSQVNWNQMEEEYVRLANKETLLEEDFVPADLVKITVRRTSGTAIEMRTIASQALTAMFDQATAEGITLYAHSGYRSYRTQKTMYYNRLERNNGVDDGAVAFPGSSDHQTGLGIDVISKEWIGKRFNADFAQTKEAQWMKENCWDYGFIIRYPEDKEEITQIIYEPWHLRYVGVAAAQYIKEENLTLEEFTPIWREQMEGESSANMQSFDPAATLTPEEISKGEISWFEEP